MLSAKDRNVALIIGAAVGLLVQPILANTLTSVHLTVTVRIGIFVFFAVFALFALWLCALIGKIWKAFYQFGQFAAVGTLNSFIDIGVFNLETFLYGASAVSILLFAIFKAISFLCATTNSFLWNKNWTFHEEHKTNAGQVTGFYTIALIGWGANVAVATFVKAIGPETKLWVDIVAPLAGILVTFLWNFIGYKYVVFKRKASSAATA